MSLKKERALFSAILPDLVKERPDDYVFIKDDEVHFFQNEADAFRFAFKRYGEKERYFVRAVCPRDVFIPTFQETDPKFFRKENACKVVLYCENCSDKVNSTNDPQIDTFRGNL